MNRRGIPHDIKVKTKKGEMKAIRLDDSMLAIKWHDKREVTALTTIHGDAQVDVERRSKSVPGGRETVQKPQAIVEYI